MRYRRLGSSDLEISEISLGSWLTYGGGVGREQAEACVAKAFEVGINFIDTANVYARGGAESFLGEVLAGRPRDSYVLATKLYFPMNGDRGLSREQVFKQIDLSLARLKTDYVDLYQCHRYDRDTPLEETMDALTEVVRQGKARYLGFSEWPADRIKAALELPSVEKFVSSQPQYSILWREPEREVFPLCAEQRHLADRLVAARAGRADRQVQARRGATPGRRAASQRHGLGDGPLPRRRRPRGRAAARADRRGTRHHNGAALAGVGAPPAGGRRPRSSGPAGPSRSRRTRPPRGSSSTTPRCRRSTRPSRRSPSRPQVVLSRTQPSTGRGS